MLFSSSPTLSHSFFSLILLQVVHLKLEANGFILVYHSFFGSHGHGREKALKGRRIVVILVMTHNMKLVKGLKRRKRTMKDAKLY
jgi:hypothetical protein